MVNLKTIASRFTSSQFENGNDENQEQSMQKSRSINNASATNISLDKDGGFINKKTKSTQMKTGKTGFKRTTNFKERER